MKITEIHVYQKDLPIVDGPYTMSTMTLHSIDTTIVKLVTSNGLVGWGEVTPLGPNYQPQHALGARAAIAHMAPELIGFSCLNHLLLRRHMDGLLNGHNYAKAAIDIAAMDLVGKHHGVRVCDLLGGATSERLPAYYAVGIGNPEKTAKIAVDKIKQGYHRLQFKIGGRDIAEDIAVMHKVWETVGNKVQLVADANRGLTATQAKQFSLSCRDIPLVMEQPCNTMDEVKSIRSQVCHPLAVDENLESVHDVLRAISMDVADAFGLKISRLGGINAMATVRDICEARAIPHSLEDTWGGDIVSAAILHVAATVKPEMLEGVWTSGNYIDEHYETVNGIEVDNGYFDMPQGSGLGITPDESRIGQLVASYG